MVLGNPHNHHLGGNLEVGGVVVVKGIAQSAPDVGDVFVSPVRQGLLFRITVNMSTSGAGYEAPNIVFQVTVRFESDEVVMNSKDAGAWGNEQKAKNTAKMGEPVDIRVIAHSDKLTVMLQRREIATYEHRMALGSVTDVFVAGALLIKGVSCGGRMLSLPYDASAGEFRRGDLLYISGETEAKATRFAINLYNGNGDTVLQFNPRFDAAEVVRNTKRGGDWGEEEKEGAFPFAKDTVFDIAVMDSGDGFTVYVDDVEWTTYRARLSDNHIVRVGVEGDLSSLHTVDVLRA